MAEEINVNEESSKEEKYKSLLPQIEALLTGEEDLIANLANTAAALKTAFDFFWVGFYLMKGNELVLGPFQGPVACTRIPLHKGVCGASATRKETIIVPDVDKFPGHIACSNASRSEIVVPLMVNIVKTEHFVSQNTEMQKDGYKKETQNVVSLLLDVDSDQLDNFDETDQKYLEELMRIIGKLHYS